MTRNEKIRVLLMRPRSDMPELDWILAGETPLCL
jgi:hypothetical protein